MELATRCREIVRALLDFARPAVSRVQQVDVQSVVRGARAVLQPQEIFHNIRVEWTPQAALPLSFGDANQLQQAFTNIILNAAEAMAGKGILRIETTPDQSGSGIVVKFSDTGSGISGEMREQLFEPFFTIKEGRSGLGLAITYGIVERHNGTIRVESRRGERTTFILTLRSMGSAGHEPVRDDPHN